MNYPYICTECAAIFDSSPAMEGRGPWDCHRCYTRKVVVKVFQDDALAPKPQDSGLAASHHLGILLRPMGRAGPAG